MNASFHVRLYMIDLCLYRLRIGCFTPTSKKRDKRNKAHYRSLKRTMSKLCSGYLDGIGLNSTLGYLVYTYYILLLIASIPCLLLDLRYNDNVSSSNIVGVPPGYPGINNTFGLMGVVLCHIRLAYFTILSYLFKNYARGLSPSKHKKHKACTPASIVFPNQSTTRLRQALASVLIFLLLLTFLMIAIVNTSLLNPGPKNLKVYYQNVQGLIPVSELNDAQPSLNRTKICELNYYIHTNKPDVLLLNETWLKKSIGDHEVIEDITYKVFRTDRSVLSHPGDTQNPKKFRKNGGGTLIANKSKLDGG